MSKISKFFTKMFTWITGAAKTADTVYDSLTDELKELVPIAVNIVQAIKTVVDSTTGTALKNSLVALCPSTAGDAAIEVSWTWLKDKGLPYLLSTLKVSSAILNITDKSKQLTAVLVALNVSESAAEEYRILAAKSLAAISDGKLTFAEAFEIVQYYYTTYVKKTA
jgi:hypothetical protein